MEERIQSFFPTDLWLDLALLEHNGQERKAELKMLISPTITTKFVALQCTGALHCLHFSPSATETMQIHFTQGFAHQWKANWSEGNLAKQTTHSSFLRQRTFGARGFQGCAWFRWQLLSHMAWGKGEGEWHWQMSLFHFPFSPYLCLLHAEKSRERAVSERPMFWPMSEVVT